MGAGLNSTDLSRQRERERDAAEFAASFKRADESSVYLLTRARQAVISSQLPPDLITPGSRSSCFWLLILSFASPKVDVSRQRHRQSKAKNRPMHRRRCRRRCRRRRRGRRRQHQSGSLRIAHGESNPKLEIHAAIIVSAQHSTHSNKGIVCVSVSVSVSVCAHQTYHPGRVRASPRTRDNTCRPGGARRHAGPDPRLGGIWSEVSARHVCSSRPESSRVESLSPRASKQAGRLRVACEEG